MIIVLDDSSDRNEDLSWVFENESTQRDLGISPVINDLTNKIYEHCVAGLIYKPLNSNSLPFLRPSMH